MEDSFENYQTLVDKSCPSILVAPTLWALIQSSSSFYGRVVALVGFRSSATPATLTNALSLVLHV